MSWIFSWFHLKKDVQFGISSIDGSYNSQEGFDGDLDHVVTGAEVNLSILEVKREYNNGELALNGPNAGLDLSLKTNGFSAMAEASVAKAEATYGPLYVSANLNANTGLKVTNKGLQFGVVGFGLTLGVGGKWTIDSPFGSLGGASSTMQVTNKNEMLLSQQYPHASLCK